TPGNGQITLNWTGSAGAASYNVKRATVNGGPYANVAGGLTAATYIDAGLTNGTTYYYVVSAISANGESGNSNQASAQPAAPQPAAPSTPTGLTATPGNSRVTLNWSAPSGATGYNVKRGTTNGGPYNTIAGGITTTSYVDSRVTNGTTYYYVLSALNTTG